MNLITRISGVSALPRDPESCSIPVKNAPRNERQARYITYYHSQRVLKQLRSENPAILEATLKKIYDVGEDRKCPGGHGNLKYETTVILPGMNYDVFRCRMCYTLLKRSVSDEELARRDEIKRIRVKASLDFDGMFRPPGLL